LATESGGTRGGGTRLHPPFAQPDPGRRAEFVDDESAPDAADAFATAPAMRAPTLADELPSIDEFLDELPLIDDFLDQRQMTATPAAGRPAADVSSAEEVWAAADWQSFDWRGAASLGSQPRESAEAHAAWSRTDWGGEGYGSFGYGGERGAGEIAAALDVLAHRIRTGEISLERFRGTPPEAVLAAAFAALLRNRA
jgi:hypothetical protein